MTRPGPDQFSGRNYLSLETRRRSGVAVATPVWFARDGDTLYAYTLADSGKVKRIRNDPRGRIAPCDMRGGLLGNWVEARSCIVTGTEATRAHDLLDEKYWLKRISGVLNRLRRREYAVIAMEPVKGG